jgi:hypothetical protein
VWSRKKNLIRMRSTLATYPTYTRTLQFELWWLHFAS